MRSKTVKENLGFNGKARVHKNRNKIMVSTFPHLGFSNVWLRPKRARELFEAGLQMCDELEAEGK